MTATTTNPRPLTLNREHVGPGLTDVRYGPYQLGTLNRVAAGWQAVATGGDVLGVFDREYRAVAALKAFNF